MPRSPRSAWSRRGVVCAGLAGVTALAVGLAGCDLDDLTGSGSGPLGTPAPADDPDQVLVDGALSAIDARLAALAAVAAGPALRGALQPLVDMHVAHRAALQPDPTPTSSGSPTAPVASASTRPPAAPARVLARTRAAESRHRDALVEAAVASRSGALARLLASMSASVTQHLLVLPADVP